MVIVDIVAQSTLVVDQETFGGILGKQITYMHI